MVRVIKIMYILVTIIYMNQYFRIHSLNVQIHDINTINHFLFTRDTILNFIIYNLKHNILILRCHSYT